MVTIAVLLLHGWCRGIMLTEGKNRTYNHINNFHLNNLTKLSTKKHIIMDRDREKLVCMNRMNMRKQVAGVAA